MDTVTILLITLSAFTAALGVMELVFWFADRERTERLAFFVACFGTVGFCAFEIAMSHSDTPERYLYFLWISQPFGSLAIVGVAWFLDTSLGTGRRWLFRTIIGLRVIVVALNFILPNGIVWKEVTAMVPVTVLGERLYYAAGVPGRFTFISSISMVLFLIFSLDASLKAWRPGNRTRVVIHGFGAALFTLTTIGLTIGIVSGYLSGPVFVAPGVLFIIAAMSFQMHLDMQKAAQLSGSLEKSETKLKAALDQLHFSADAGEVGLWRRSFAERTFWSSEKANELFGFEPDAEVSPQEFLAQVHEDDRERVTAAMRRIGNEAANFEIECRIRHPDGTVRWINSRGGIEPGEPTSVRGASVDVTKRRSAEQEVHDLAQKLMNAQEAERTRLARDLHDGLSQRIALLYIQVGELRNHFRDPQHLETGIDYLTERLKVLGADVRRISHELHPAKLQQLGLEVALGAFCREIAANHSLKVDFITADLPTEINEDMAICFYRVAQESLQNVVKHGNATRADVRLAGENNELVLEVSDDGTGFDVEAVRSKGTLGLVSMSERMRAVAGESRVRSVPGKGTTVDARAPL